MTRDLDASDASAVALHTNSTEPAAAQETLAAATLGQAARFPTGCACRFLKASTASGHGRVRGPESDAAALG